MFNKTLNMHIVDKEVKNKTQLSGEYFKAVNPSANEAEGSFCVPRIKLIKV